MVFLLCLCHLLKFWLVKYILIIHKYFCSVSLEQETCSHNMHPMTCFTALLCQAHFVEKLLTVYGFFVLLLLFVLWKPSIETSHQ